MNAPSPRLPRLRQTVGALFPGAGAQRSLLQLFVLLGSLIGLHIVAMMVFEHLPPADALWLTLTTVTTVGYGDLAPRTPYGRLSTGLLIFFGGIWVTFQTAATYFDLRSERRQRMRCGRWRWNMRDHILILNVPLDNTTAYLTRLVTEFRASRRFRHRPVQIVSTCFDDGLPESLRELGVVHHSGESWDSVALDAAGARHAHVIIVLAQSDADPSTDGRTLDIVDRLKELGAEGRIIAEAVEDTNRPRFRRFGAELVVRPLRGYPEMIVRALAAPGSEAILEDLFTSKRDECWRYDITVEGWIWSNVVTTLVLKDIGVPIAFRSAQDHNIKINPHPSALVHADKLYVLVREGNARNDAEIQALLPPQFKQGSAPTAASPQGQKVTT